MRVKNYHLFRLEYKSRNFDNDYADNSPFCIDFNSLEDLLKFRKEFRQKATDLGVLEFQTYNFSMQNYVNFSVLDGFEGEKLISQNLPKCFQRILGYPIPDGFG